MDGFKDGYNFFSDLVGEGQGALNGEAYVSGIEEEIDKLFNDPDVGLNSFKGFQTASDQLKGDVAEFWHAGTYNIDAAIHDSSNRAEVPRSHILGSPDVVLHTKDGVTEYSAKIYKDAEGSVKAQSVTYRQKYNHFLKNHPGTSFEDFLEKEHVPVEDRGSLDQIGDKSIYDHQVRLLAKDQQDDARRIARQKMAKEIYNEKNSARGRQGERYKGQYTDHVRDKEGNHSFAEDNKTFQEMAERSKKGEARADDYHLTTEEVVKFKHIFRQAAKAGVSATTISVVLKVGPELFKAVEYLIQTGYIDSEQLKKVGAAAIQGTAEGFLRGSAAAALSIVCKAGFFGSIVKNVSPADVGALTTVTINTLKNAIDWALGKINASQFSDKLTRDIFLSTCSLILGKVVGTLFGSFCVLGYMLGSFIGSMVGGFLLSKGHEILMSICIDTGFTCFGLVKQDYQIPDQILKDLGLDTIDMDFQNLDSISYRNEEMLDTVDLDKIHLDSLDIYPVKRGIIGVSTIGYIR